MPVWLAIYISRFDVAPTLSKFNFGNNCLRDTEQSGNESLPVPGEQHGSYLKHLEFRELGHLACLPFRVNSKCVRSVLEVFRSSNPFKVLASIVMLDTVFMVNFWSFQIFRKKGFCHQSMRCSGVGFSEMRKDHITVSSGMWFLFEWWSGFPRWMRRSLYISEVANRIMRELFDCFPNLTGSINCFRHVWPFYSRLPLFRCSQWSNPPLVVSNDHLTVNP